MKLWSKKIKGQYFKTEYHPMQCLRHIKKIKNHLKTLTLVDLPFKLYIEL